MNRVVLFLIMCSFALMGCDGCEASVEGELKASATGRIGEIEEVSEVSNTSDEELRRKWERRWEAERQRDELLRRERERASEHLKEQLAQQAREMQALGDEVRRLEEREDKRRDELLLKGQQELKKQQGDILGTVEEGLDWLEENERARHYERPRPAYKPDSEWRPVIQHSQRRRQVEPSDGGVQKNGFIVPLEHVESSVEVNITSEEVLMDSILIRDATNEEMVHPKSPQWYGFTTTAPVLWIRVWGDGQRSNKLKLRVRDGEVVVVDVVQEVDRLRLKKRKQKRLP